MVNRRCSCGSEADINHRFCEYCGKEITGTESSSSDGNDNFGIGADGKYHWYYELSLFKNPTVFITVCKVFGGVIIGCGLMIGLLIQEDFVHTVKFVLSLWAWGFGGFLVLGGFSYCVYAAIQGGKYCVLFDMDRKSITHTQVAKQFKKAQVIGLLAVLMGAAKGSLTLTGSGILTASHNSVKTKFKLVSLVRANRRRNVIHLKAGFFWNQIYVKSEHFDEVLDFILSCIPKTAERKGIEK